MTKMAIALLLWSSCAPLTSPEGLGPGNWQEPAAEAEVASALESYMAARQRYGDGPRPDFMAVVPFVDESGFQEGIWNLEYEMANLLSIELGAISGWQVVPFNAVAELAMEAGAVDRVRALEIAHRLEADVVLVGLLQDYNLRRFSAGDPLLGGLKSYTAVAQMRVEVIQVVDGGEMGTVGTARELNDRDLGLDLLGRPREQDVQFAELREVEFGSEKFRQTLLGRATLEAMDDMVQKVAAVFKPGGIDIQNVSPEIISVYGDDIYTNLGSEHGLRPRFRFAVYPSPDRVETEGLEAQQALAVVEVAEVIGARLSSLQILSQTGAIKPGDRLKLVEVQGE